MRRTLLLSAASLAVVAATFSIESDAAACGGCFVPPETPTVVTDHRMILTIARDQSTLYDQIRYSGDPASFAWVLPISGTVDVGLSADVVFQSLDQVTQTQVLPPPRNCPPPPRCDNDGLASASPSSGERAADDGVEVTKREVVGPYDTVQLRATNPTALQEWLAANGFSLPDDVKPIVGTYVAERFDFLALKLLPGKGVQDMRPVRVTSKGASAVLPLRMVAAGTGPVVGISLWVVGEGRYEPQNFPTYQILSDELHWNWTTNQSDYKEVRAQKTTAGGGRVWEVESSTILYRQQLEQQIRRGAPSLPQATDAYYETQAQQDYAPILNPDGTVKKTAAQVREEDLSTLFYGIPTATSRTTRMRADLAHASLDADLVMSASTNQDVLATVRQVTKETNQPLCPVYSGCSVTGQLPRDQAANASSGSTETFACTATMRKARTTPAWIGAGAAVAALAIARAVRRRRG